MAQTVLHPDLLEFCVRDELNRTATRLAHQLGTLACSGHHLVQVESLQSVCTYCVEVVYLVE